ncbi:MraZ protein [Gordonia bronchialis DSM 43247]|jgi:MraZ protein|uniref:Transcriptional regulator MraZ n=1 Tax=Gordonia bronchialis (strain ATCC 25592 / DSM 43247 / BCRC 13721 / JCM 3198 / KCTC 3076 / NBRC 16047 / NCTC 10667) TaxID=526226 RepID=D0LAU0_GORB4|nr:division/cell wall cluster transcriptional repressor MraZ [Gordonia bronchialis]ACY22233.1 MraZ protein [Gordonia bronchialis DSM 43247]MCC3325024.1 division/cell wall cluster transcriptional repressor MraZ [Gordonia bronchialis]QGS24223.1 division/cell wall cluster transcriptional repressor MraZ [Gordonia bronchialis]UAK39578.1 division/cell wall cluster transcriptional repressor MraZ [Gordonia bronchialis]STQ65157.1 cell division protein MraZ [Gordonia bronchialis]
MSVRFVGTYTPKLDDKGRLTLPARFRDALAGGVMVTKGQDHSLSVYRAEEFDVIAGKIVEASRNDPEARAFQRYFFASSEEQRPDGQGRITLSADHRSYAGLSKECVVFGSFDHLEIWDAAAWRDYQSQHEENFSAANSAALNAVL